MTEAPADGKEPNARRRQRSNSARPAAAPASEAAHGPPLQVTAEGVEPHPHRTGHFRTDRIIAGAAILMSLLSLLVAYKHGLIMRDLVAANSWPLLQATTSNIDDQGRSVILMEIQNVGVGPAIVKSFYAEYDGRRTSDAHALLTACCGRVPSAGKFAAGDPITGVVESTVIKSNEDRTFLKLERAPRSDAAWRLLNEARFNVRYGACYCSVLGQCWESDLTGINPRAVDECAIPERSR